MTKSNLNLGYQNEDRLREIHEASVMSDQLVVATLVLVALVGLAEVFFQTKEFWK